MQRCRVLFNRQFTVAAACIQPLTTPTEFYETLVELARGSKQRISLSSLYFGTGELEQRLLTEIIGSAQRAAAARSPLRVQVQLDYSRCMRPVATKSYAMEASATPIDSYTSSAHMMLELKRRVGGGSTAHVGFTLMPQVRGLLGRIVPPRWVEGGGVFHMKAYAFDDTVVLTGANLSHDYFTNRQDRYVVVNNDAAFAEYVHGLVGGFHTLPGTMLLDAEGRVTPVPRSEAGEFHSSVHTGACVGTQTDDVAASDMTRSHAEAAATLRTGAQLQPNALPSITRPRYADLGSSRLANDSLKQYLTSQSSHSVHVAPEPADSSMAVLTPRLQLGHLGVRFDEAATMALFHSLPPGRDSSASAADGGAAAGMLHIASGYFNVTSAYAQALIHGRPGSSIHIVTAAPQANGFYGAHGSSASVPMAYSEAERKFLTRVAQVGRCHSNPRLTPAHPGITMYEYARPGWTFHGKGLWLSRLQVGSNAAVGMLPYAAEGMVTYVGSPNFGRRSVDRDLELQVEVRTSNAALIGRLEAERDRLFGSTAASGTTGTGDSGDIHPVNVFGPKNVFSRPERTVGGWSYERGLWIHVVGPITTSFF